MKIGIVGLGKMGGGVAHRLLKSGYTVVGFDFSSTACDAAQRDGCAIAPRIEELAKNVDMLWIFVPAGDPVDAVIERALPLVSQKTVIIDGGNSHFPDSLRRARHCLDRGIFFLDCGTSGGVIGRERGYALMIGGDKKAYDYVMPACIAIAAPDSVAHVGPSGAGHYVKMIHNGIEYGIMQAYAEGFHLLKEGSFKEASLDLETIARIWQNGALVRSWFLELTHDILKKDQQLSTVSGKLFESGTGQWTVEEAHKQHIPVPVIEASLHVRAWSRQTGGNYATKIIALLRNTFGGHTLGNNTHIP